MLQGLYIRFCVKVGFLTQADLKGIFYAAGGFLRLKLAHF